MVKVKGLRGGSNRLLHIPGRFPIRAIIAFGGRFGGFFRHETFFDRFQGARDPRIVAGIRNKVDIEFQLGIESRAVGPAIAIHKKSGWGNHEAVHAEEPLIDFHLALVADLPFLVEGDFLGFAGGFVIYDDELPFGVGPDVIDGAGHVQVGRGVHEADAFEIAAPEIEVFMLEWHDVLQSVGVHQGMRTLLGAMNVEFFFEQSVDGRVEREWIARRTGDTKPTIEIETERAVHEQVDLGAAHPKRLGALWVEKIARSAGIVVVGHEDILACKKGRRTVKRGGLGG